MDNQPKQIVYPVQDIAKAKAIFTALLGTEPYADFPYYVGYKTEGGEIGLDPRGTSTGPIPYWDVADAKASLDALVAAGAEAKQEPKDVGGGLLIALALDADGNTIGLRQSPA